MFETLVSLSATVNICRDVETTVNRLGIFLSKPFHSNPEAFIHNPINCCIPSIVAGVRPVLERPCTLGTSRCWNPCHTFDRDFRTNAIQNLCKNLTIHFLLTYSLILSGGKILKIVVSLKKMHFSQGKVDPIPHHYGNSRETTAQYIDLAAVAASVPPQSARCLCVRDCAVACSLLSLVAAGQSRLLLLLPSNTTLH